MYDVSGNYSPLAFNESIFVILTNLSYLKLCSLIICIIIVINLGSLIIWIQVQVEEDEMPGAYSMNVGEEERV
jgi:hypothetical protein